MGSIDLTSYRTFLSTRSKHLCAEKSASPKKIPEIHFRTPLGSLEADFLLLRKTFGAPRTYFAPLKELLNATKRSRRVSWTCWNAPGRHLGASRALRELPRTPQKYEKPMKSLRKTRFSEKLALERFPRAQATPGSHFGSLWVPHPPPAPPSPSTF